MAVGNVPGASFQGSSKPEENSGLRCRTGIQPRERRLVKAATAIMRQFPTGLVQRSALRVQVGLTRRSFCRDPIPSSLSRGVSPTRQVPMAGTRAGAQRRFRIGAASDPLRNAELGCRVLPTYATGTTVTFSYTGSAQSWTVPSGVSSSKSTYKEHKAKVLTVGSAAGWWPHSA